MTEHSSDGIDTEYGIVREVPPAEERESSVYGIEITVPGACDTCSIKDNCYGNGSMVYAQSPDRLEPGERVLLAMRRGTVLKATAWVYGIPLAAILVGVLTGHQWLFSSSTEPVRVLLSVGLGVGMMLAAGYVLARHNQWVGSRLTITAYRD